MFLCKGPHHGEERGMAILKVCDYLEDYQLERFPMRELTLYRFMYSQLAEGAPASRLQGVRSLPSVVMCWMSQSCKLFLDSKRCSGVAREVCPKNGNRRTH